MDSVTMAFNDERSDQRGRISEDMIDAEVRRHIRIQLLMATVLTALILLALVLGQSGHVGSPSAFLEEGKRLWLTSVKNGYALLVRIAGAFVLATLIFGAAKFLWRLRGPIQPKKLTWRQLRHEIIFSTIWLWSAAVTGIIGALAAQAGWLKMYPDFWSRGPLYFALTLLVMVVGYDFYFYCVHRLLHWGPLWKYVHSVHHITTSPNPLTQFQLSPAEQVVTIVFVVGLGTVLPLHPMAWVTFSFLSIARSAIGHANVEVFPKAFAESKYLRWISMGTHHNLHHRDFVYDFAVFLTIWDRAFGTLHPQYYELARDLPELRAAERAR